MKTSVFCLFLVISLAYCNNNENMNIDTSTVKNYELDKYLGTWYEIARFPHSFEKGLVGVTANYSLRKDGKIQVINQGYKNSFDGKLKKAKGKAWIPDPEKPGKLKVAFFWFFGADYYIMELDTINYEYALIGSSSDNYLWILNRKPQMPEETYKMLKNKAKQRGYDLSRLIEVEQKPKDN